MLPRAIPRRRPRSLPSGRLRRLVALLHLAGVIAAHAGEAGPPGEPAPPPETGAHRPAPREVDVGRRFGLCTRREGQTLFRWSDATNAPTEPPKWEQPLSSDRPDFTESSTTVGCGLVQIESGYTFTLDESGGIRTVNHSFPEALARIGLFADWFEAR